MGKRPRFGWTYPWARPWCPVWPWPPAGPDYFPPGLLCPSPSAPYSILLSSSQTNQTKEDFSYLWKSQNRFLSFPSGFPASPWGPWLVASPKHLHICSWCTQVWLFQKCQLVNLNLISQILDKSIATIRKDGHKKNSLGLLSSKKNVVTFLKPYIIRMLRMLSYIIRMHRM